MKTIFDLSLLDGVLKEIRDGAELENKIKAEVEKTPSAAFREKFLYIPISGNRYDPYAFEYLDCYIVLHLKRIYSTKTWRPIKDIYTVEAYRIRHAIRKTVYDNFTVQEYKKALISCISDIEKVDTAGNPV